MRLQPRLKMPLWAAVAIPAAAYLIRAAIWGTLRPQLPDDAVVFGALLIVLVLAATMGTAAQSRRAHSGDELDGDHDSKRGPGQDDEV